jgi:hypothetical protein
MERVLVTFFGIAKGVKSIVASTVMMGTVISQNLNNN